MPDVIVVGGGLAGMAAAAALGGAGHRVRIFEARGFPGGRASSNLLSLPDLRAELIDNGQHVLLRCCTNLLNFYRRLGVLDRIEFHDELHFVEPGGRTSVVGPGTLDPPLHFLGPFFKVKFLSWIDKLAVLWAVAAIRREYRRRKDLDRITMLQWLREKRQPARAIARLWRPLLMSIVNDDLDRIAAGHGFQLFWRSLFEGQKGYELGIPKVPLGDLYSMDLWDSIPGVEWLLDTPVDRLERGETGGLAGLIAGGQRYLADYYVLAVPFEEAEALVPWLGLNLTLFEYSPITNIHLWLDRSITDLPHATLLDRTIQAAYAKDEGRYIQAVVGASRGLVDKRHSELVGLALEELAEFFPAAREAKLLKAHVVQETHAAFSARPGLETARPGPGTVTANLFLAGDWTNTGWPSTMEGAVRSGYIAAEAVAAVSGAPKRFLIEED